MELFLRRMFVPGYEDVDSDESSDAVVVPVVEDKNKDEVKDKDEPKGSGEEQKFTQEDLNKHVAKERRKLQGKNEELAKELEAANKGRELSTEEKANLEKALEDLRTAHMTDQEVAKRERAKISKAAKERETTLVAERDEWQARYQNSTISRAITDAAVRHEAYNSTQIDAILRPMTRLVEKQDDAGTGTGDFSARVKMPAINTEGTSVELDLTVDEAVKHMLEDTDSYGNLFKSIVKSGLGLDNAPAKVGNIDISKLTPAQYRKHRDEIKAAASRA